MPQLKDYAIGIIRLKDDAIGKRKSKLCVEQTLGILVVINYELVSISSTTESIKNFQQETVHVSAP